jgi:4-diphosphocytidyl-2-C-methyl-D-erythritol kinase
LSINIKAYAKLNLGLKVIGKRHDGYHFLSSILVLIDVYDSIKITQLSSSQDITLTHSPTQVWLITTDLAYRAAKLLQQYSNSTYSAAIHIDKRIPSGAGMGGGSSNAAAVLSGLNQLWQLNLSQDTLLQLALQLGADVPFFITQFTAAQVTGIGELVVTYKLEKQLFFVIVVPDVELSTAAVFAAFDENRTILDDSTATVLSTTDKPNIGLLLSGINDLQHTACLLYPALADIIASLECYGKPMMTGSGSAVYLRYDSLQHAQCIAAKLSTIYHTVLVTQSIEI